MIKIIPDSIFGKIRLAISSTILLVLMVRFIIVPCFWWLQYKDIAEEGDIIFQSLPNWIPEINFANIKIPNLTDLIETVSNSKFSHVGVVTKKNNTYYVIESFGPVHETWLPIYLMKGRLYGLSPNFEVYRFKKRYHENIQNFISKLRLQIGIPYNYTFNYTGYGTYCSKLLHIAWKSITNENLGEVNTVQQLNWQPFLNHFYTRDMFPGGAPMDMQVITPKAISEAPQLEKFY